MPATRKRTHNNTTTTTTTTTTMKSSTATVKDSVTGFSELPCLLGHTIPDGHGGKIQLTQLLGKGSFAVVYRGIHSSPSSHHQQQYAVKVLFKQNLTPRQLSLLRQEAAIMKSLSSHRNILKLYGTIETDNHIFLVTEFCEMDFYEALINYYPAGFPEDVVKEIFDQLANALIYSHSRGIYHRDLKPENILISKNYDVKLADWGLATMHTWSTEFGCGSTRYMSPECLNSELSNGKGYSTPSNDTWSLAVFLINLLYGRNPWHEASLDDPLYAAFSGSNPHILAEQFGMSPECEAVFARALHSDPSCRYSLADLRDAVAGIDFFSTTSSSSSSSSGATAAAMDNEKEEDAKKANQSNTKYMTGHSSAVLVHAIDQHMVSCPSSSTTASSSSTSSVYLSSSSDTTKTFPMEEEDAGIVDDDVASDLVETASQILSQHIDHHPISNDNNNHNKYTASTTTTTGSTSTTTTSLSSYLPRTPPPTPITVTIPPRSQAHNGHRRHDSLDDIMPPPFTPSSPAHQFAVSPSSSIMFSPAAPSSSSPQSSSMYFPPTGTHVHPYHHLHQYRQAGAKEDDGLLFSFEHQPLITTMATHNQTSLFCPKPRPAQQQQQQLPLSLLIPPPYHHHHHHQNNHVQKSFSSCDDMAWIEAASTSLMNLSMQQQRLHQEQQQEEEEYEHHNAFDHHQRFALGRSFSGL